MKPELSEAGSAHENLLGLPCWEELSLVQVASVPRVEDEDARRILRRQLLAGIIDAGAAGRPLLTIWTRAKTTALLHVYLSSTGHGDGVDPAGSDQVGTRPDPLLLPHPPGARGWPVPTADVSSSLAEQEYWVRCGAIIDPLLVSAQSSDRIAPAAFDDYAAFLGDTPFAWLVLAEPQPPSIVDEQLESLRREISSLQAKAGASMASTLDCERAEARYRELMTSRSAGIWSVHVLVGAATPADASRVASLLCSGADLDGLPYRLLPRGEPVKLATVTRRENADAGSSPFLATSEVLAHLVKPPEKELPGVQTVARSTFDTSPEAYPKPSALPHPLARAGPGSVKHGFALDETLRPTQPSDAGARVELGTVLDQFLRSAGPLTIGLDTLNRHTFVCGATGGGKSQTVRGLLETLSRRTPAIPWLVIEPAKAEYARMAGRLEDLVGLDVLVIAPGDPQAPPASINPLEPASLEPGNPARTFPLQSHADLVRALFMAAFHADEPFPQVLSRALTQCYEAAGWDLVTGEPLLNWDRTTGQPTPGVGERSLSRYPTLASLQKMAQQVVEEIGYGDDIKKNVRGFVDVRIGSLRLGTPGRLFEGGHPLDVAALLKRNVVLELEGITNDQDKAFVMGAVLIRLYEQLLLEERERFASDKTLAQLRHITVVEEAHRLLRNVPVDSPAAHSLELFASLLAEIRAYGEGIIVAEQIPSKLISDVLKNTALKIVHRLPAADDREAVGATMNLSEAQSQYVVTLAPGTAAVFADGMDRPILARMSSREDREDAQGAVRLPPLVAGQRRSRFCGAQCRNGEPCLLGDLRRAERFLEDHPELTFWTEVSFAAHGVGYPAPGVADTHALRELREGATKDPRQVECAIAHAVERATSSRYENLTAFFDPEALGAHLQHVATQLFLGTGDKLTCADDRGDWRVGGQRFGDIADGLSKLAKGERAPFTHDEYLHRAAARGLDLGPGPVAIQLSYLESLPWTHFKDTKQRALLVGSQIHTQLLKAAAAIAGPGKPSDQITNASARVLVWANPTQPQKLLSQLVPPEAPEKETAK